MKRKNWLIGAFITIVLFFCVWSYQKFQLTFSVIIPVYNAEAYLERCLDSVFAQKGTYEVIVINDGSTDGTENILKKYSKKHSNLVVINQTNKGVSKARNKGLEVAKMKYITFVDSDDWLEANSFENIRKIIKKDNSDVVLTSYYDVYDENWLKGMVGEENLGDIKKKERKYIANDLERLVLFSPFYAKESLNDLFYIAYVHGQFYRNDFIKEHNIKFDDIIYEDGIFNFKVYVNNPLISIDTHIGYNYLNRLDSLSKSIKIMRGADDALKALESTKEYKTATRKEQMLMQDSWLFLYILSVSNVSRGQGNIKELVSLSKKALENMSSIYNFEELKSCRNFQKLYRLLYEQKA